MIEYEYLTPGACMARFPLVYHDAEQTDKAQRYLVLHEVKDRWNNNWAMGNQWRQYKGVVTWNPRVYADNKAEYNMLFCRQFPNMYAERVETYVPFCKRTREVCAIYGPCASVDSNIMNARYDVPLALSSLGMSVDAYGVIPESHRPEYRTEWGNLFRGSLPIHRKRDALGQHRFGMAFENSRDPYFAMGWVTEKIYDCLGSACIPIYWGAPDITDFVPAELFVDYRMFTGLHDLFGYLKKTPESTFSQMAEDGLAFFDTVRFDEYLDVFDTLK